MRIPVTGAAGFIGSHLAERFCRDGHDVVGIECFTDYYSRALKEINARDVADAGARMFEIDLAQDDLSEACEGVEVIYHCAAQPGICRSTPYATYARNNMTATYIMAMSDCGSRVWRRRKRGRHSTPWALTCSKQCIGWACLCARWKTPPKSRTGMPSCSLREAVFPPPTR